MKYFILSLILALSLICSNATAAFKIPEYQAFKMENGLQVYIMQQSEVPLIDVRLVVKAGGINDSKDYGLAEMTSSALSFGSGKLSKTEVEDQLAFYGAKYGASSNKEMTTISLSLATKDQKQLLKLFADIVLKPHFSEIEFNKFKKRYLSQLKQQRESPKNIIGDVFDRLYYGNHPYGNPVSGDANSIEKIDLMKVKSFHENYYTPKNSALIVVGDFNPNAMKKQLNKLFSKWSGSTSEVQALAKVVKPKSSNVWLVDKDDAIETTFIVGGKGIDAKHPDYVAAQVLNTILGGRFTSWLNDALRVNSGLTYGARSRFDTLAVSGTFSISTFTKKETTFQALDLALKTYTRLWDEGIDEATLTSAKAYVKGQFPPRYETSSQLANLLSRMWALDLGVSFINDFEKNVDALDVKKANELVKKLFPKDSLQFVLIGKASEIIEQAKKYGELKELDIKEFNF